MVPLYLPRNWSGMDFIGVEVCMTSECKLLHEYLQNSQEWLLKGALNRNVLMKTVMMTDYGKLICDEKVDPCRKKDLHGARNPRDSR